MEQKRRYNILVTGGCGFIGWNFLRRLFQTDEIDFNVVVNLDCKDYAAINPEYDEVYDNRYIFEQGDIQYSSYAVINTYKIDLVINFAAKTHVDNSIESSQSFVDTNIVGFYTLMDNCKKYWDKNNIDGKFIQISTDEVYGSVENNGGESFTEQSKFHPNNPYSASKASAELMALSYYHTYNFPIIITNCSNNYGPGQHKEKLIPRTIHNCLENMDIPIYGDGFQCRDWIYVDDHCDGILKVIQKGKNGQRYLFGTDKIIYNKFLVNDIQEFMLERYEILSAVKHVPDRLGHDRVYRINYNKAKCELGWEPKVDLVEGLEKTIKWYVNNTK